MLPATRSRGNSSRTIPNASGKMPPPAPWITRPMIIGSKELDRAAIRIPTARIPSVTSSIFSLPYMSPRRPRIDVATDAESRYPVSSQVTPVSVVFRLCCRSVRAGMTAELSIA